MTTAGDPLSLRRTLGNATAETAEAAAAYAVAGDDARAGTLLATVRDKRLTSGGYLTGLVYPERSEFPAGERRAPTPPPRSC